jgi:TRAP-type C4-dicarboxylate transport system substrate-binding protein
MQRTLKFLNASAVCLTGIMVTLSHAHAQETITLKLAHPLPAGHYAWEQGIKKFTETVTKSTNGKVRFAVFPAGQLGKDNYALLKSGLADVAMVITSYAPDKFPMTSVTELPGLHTTACQATSKFWELAKPGAILATKEYTPRGIQALFVSTLPSYRLMTTSKKVTSLDQIAGLKIYANGQAMDKTIRALGGVPVHLTGSELHDGLSRGTLDGAIFSYSSVPQYGLQKELRYSIEGPKLGSTSWFVAVSAKTWKALPEDAKKAMTAAGIQTQRDLCAWMDVDVENARNRLTKENGHSVLNLTAEQTAQWDAKIGNVPGEWAAEMDRAGRGGAELLKKMQAASSTTLTK